LSVAGRGMSAVINLPSAVYPLRRRYPSSPWPGVQPGLWNGAIPLPLNERWYQKSTRLPERPTQTGHLPRLERLGRLDPFKTYGAQVVIGRIVIGRASSRILFIAVRNDDDHALAGTRQEYPVGILKVGLSL